MFLPLLFPIYGGALLRVPKLTGSSLQNMHLFPRSKDPQMFASLKYCSAAFVVALTFASSASAQSPAIKVSAEGDLVIETNGSGKLFVDNTDVVATISKCTADIEDLVRHYSTDI